MKRNDDEKQKIKWVKSPVEEVIRESVSRKEEKLLESPSWTAADAIKSLSSLLLYQKGNRKKNVPAADAYNLCLGSQIFSHSSLPLLLVQIDFLILVSLHFSAVLLLLRLVSLPRFLHTKKSSSSSSSPSFSSSSWSSCVQLSFWESQVPMKDVARNAYTRRDMREREAIRFQNEREKDMQRFNKIPSFYTEAKLKMTTREANYWPLVSLILMTKKGKSFLSKHEVSRHLEQHEKKPSLSLHFLSFYFFYMKRELEKKKKAHRQEDKEACEHHDRV